MDSLEKYAEEFDKSYPDYAYARYGEIIKLIEAYDKPGLSEFIEGEEFKKFVSLVRPVIAIKNYKSQIPFPEDLASVVRCVISIRSTRPSPKDILKNHRTCFNELMSLQGFQLPTVSAILHFCHPEYFPIVDINVKAASR